MAERDVPPTPDNFQVFFAFAAGDPPAVSRDVAEMFAQKEAFTPQALHDLRTRYFRSDRLETAMEDIGTEINDSIKSVLDKLAAAGRDTEAYGKKLSAASGELDGEHSPAQMERLVKSLMGATRAMEARTRTLEGELQRSSHEVAELRTKLDCVRKESLQDPLTGICNRKAFDSELADAIAHARSSGEPLSLFMCDIDHFKLFNDTWGHQTGDQVLRLVAQCLSENVKGRDTAARYGGEEFVVIVRQTPLKGAMTLADQIRAGVEAKRLVKRSTGDILGRLTVSIGVAELGPGDGAAEFIHRADACLYAAKNGGRNRVVGEGHIARSAGQIIAA